MVVQLRVRFSQMPIQLPLEVIHLIILYIPTTNLRLLCEEDDSLKPLIAPILYKYVSIRGLYDNFGAYPGHGYRTTEFHDITLLELNELVSGSIDANIQHLKIRECDDDVKYCEKFWKLVRDSSEFFLKIPIIDFTGADFTKCMEFLPVRNIRHLSTGDSNPPYFQVDTFPPNITDLTICGSRIVNIPHLPKSLKHLKILSPALFSDRTGPFELPEGLLKLVTNNVHNISLPDSLIELEVNEADSLDTFPPGLKKLSVHSIASFAGIVFPSMLEVLHLSRAGLTTLEDVIFPSLLRELSLRRNKLKILDDVILSNLLHLEVLDLCYAGLTTLEDVVFPRLLRELNLRVNDIGNLDGVILSGLLHLEVLDLSYTDLTTLEDVVFPSLLRELKLQGNKLGSLDIDMFPNLIFLDISEGNNAIKSLSHVQFPKLEHLLAGDQPVEDWSMTGFPETLKELQITVMEEPRTLKFPPHLTVLKIHFLDDLAEYADLQLPNTLEDLVLSGGVSSIFEWNLPQLRSMNICSDTGPIKVPESVVDLSCLSLERIILPPNLEVLDTLFPLEEYPATVSHVRIRSCGGDTVFPLPPNVESVYVDSGELNGSLFTPPNSLNYFHGTFNKYKLLNTPCNWDEDNQYYSEDYDTTSDVDTSDNDTSDVDTSDYDTSDNDTSDNDTSDNDTSDNTSDDEHPITYTLIRG